MNKDHIDNLSTELMNAHRTRQLVGDYPRRSEGLSLEEAYAVQDKVAEQLWCSQGQRIQAWKTGILDNGENFAAPIGPVYLYQSPIKLNAHDFHQVHVEAELTYRLKHDMPSRETPYTENEIADAIESVHVAIEILDSRLQDWESVDKHLALADNQVNGALIIGSGITDWQRVRCIEQAVELIVDGNILEDRVGSHPQENPFLLMPWAVNHCAIRGAQLCAGDWVTTGTWTGYLKVRPGAEVVVRFPGIGEAQFILVPD